MIKVQRTVTAGSLLTWQSTKYCVPSTGDSKLAPMTPTLYCHWATAASKLTMTGKLAMTDVRTIWGPVASNLKHVLSINDVDYPD